MASKKEERERRRAERLAAERRETSGQRLRLILGYAAAGLIAIAVIAGLGIAIAGGDGDGGEFTAAEAPDEAFINTNVGVARDLEPDGREGTPPPPLAVGDVEESAEAAGCELQTDLPDEGSQHFTEEDHDPGWETNPPTSGDHYGVPGEPGSGALADGAYLELPSQGRVVHALEHGRIAFQYSPDLPEDDQLAIKGVFDEERGAGLMMFPNPEMPFAVAATAWRQKLSCESFEGQPTLDALRNFRDVFRGRGPENVPVHVPR